MEGIGNNAVIAADQLQAPSPPTQIWLQEDEDELHNTEGQDTTDGMGAITFAREEDSGYFGRCMHRTTLCTHLIWRSGPSSNIAFTRKIIRTTASILKSAAPDASPVPPNYDGIQSYILRRSRAVSPVEDQTHQVPNNFSNVEAFALPSESETLPLIDKYFRTTGVLFPYIDGVEFLKTYRQMASTNIHTVRRSWLGLLNMVLAMSVHVDCGSEVAALERAARSDIFFWRAMALCDKQIRHGTSLEVGKH